MRIHFDGVRRPARVAKLLRAEMASLGVTIGLGGAQDVAARAFGYLHYKELQALAGTQAASPWDEACEPDEVARRHRRQADAFRQAGLTQAQAVDLVARLKPSGRNLGTEPRASGDEDGEYASLGVPAGLVTGPDGWNVIDNEEYKVILGLPPNTLRAAYQPHMIALPNGWVIASPEFFEGDISGRMRDLADFGYHVERRIVVTKSLISTLQESANARLPPGLPALDPAAGENPFLGEVRETWLESAKLAGLRRSYAYTLREQDSRYLAILADGKLLLDIDHADDPETVAARLRTWAGKPPTMVILVPPPVIEAFRTVPGRGAVHHVAIGNPRARTALADLIRHAVELGASAISVSAGAEGGVAHARIDGANASIRDFSGQDANEIMEEAYGLCEGPGTSYRPSDVQRGRMTRGGGFVPPALQAMALEWVPTAGLGRHMSARLLYAHGETGPERETSLEDLGYTPEHAKQIRRMMRRPSGLNVVSGPVGAGKSRTLQVLLGAGLRDASSGRKVTTVEEVTSCLIPGANQVEVRHAGTEAERREGFRQAIQAGLRSSPDVLMIGELRESYAADAAYQASSTGCQVWTTTRANDALGTLDLLRTLGIEAFRAYDHTLVGGLVAQRLVRRTCTECSLGYADAYARDLTDDGMGETLGNLIGQAALFTDVRFANPDGCEHCRSGHKGRVLVAEVVVPTRPLMETLRDSGKQAARDHWIQAYGGKPMLMHAIDLIAAGTLDPNEVEMRVGLLDEIDPDEWKLVANRAAKAA